MGWFQRRAANFVLVPMNAFPFFFWWIPTSDRSWERTFGKGTPPCSAGRNSTPMAMDIKGTLFGSMDRFLKKRKNCVPGKGIRWFMETQRDSKPQVIPPKSNRASAAISLCQKEPFGKNHPKPPQKTASLARGHGPKVPQGRQVFGNFLQALVPHVNVCFVQLGNRPNSSKRCVECSWHPKTLLRVRCTLQLGDR